MGVRRVPSTHLFNRGGEQAGPIEDVSILGEEAEDQPRHEMVHVWAAIGRAPLGIVLQKLDIKPVQAAGGPDVERAFADLFNRRDASERKEKTEMIREVPISAGGRLTARKVLGLESVSIGRQNELGLGSGGRWADLKRGERLRDLAGAYDGDMDVVGLKNSANVGLVRLSFAKALEGRLLVAEGLEEGEGELL